MPTYRVTVCSAVFDIVAGDADEAIDDALAQADYDVEEIEDEEAEEEGDDELDEDEEGDDEDDE
jgi:hypothetical protein